MPHSRLTGTPGFLRTMAVPRLQETALRLSMARHQAHLEDLLDAPEPVLQLTLRPWSSPLAEEKPGVGHLVIGIQTLAQEYVTLRYWVGGPDGAPPRDDRIATDKITSSWLDCRLLDFIGFVLGEA
jgi:hypothetical protein